MIASSHGLWLPTVVLVTCTVTEEARVICTQQKISMASFAGILVTSHMQFQLVMTQTFPELILNKGHPQLCSSSLCVSSRSKWDLQSLVRLCCEVEYVAFCLKSLVPVLKPNLTEKCSISHLQVLSLAGKIWYNFNNSFYFSESLHQV